MIVFEYLVFKLVFSHCSIDMSCLSDTFLHSDHFYSIANQWKQDGLGAKICLAYPSPFDLLRLCLEQVPAVLSLLQYIGGNSLPTSLVSQPFIIINDFF